MARIRVNVDVPPSLANVKRRHLPAEIRISVANFCVIAERDTPLARGLDICRCVALTVARGLFAFYNCILRYA